MRADRLTILAEWLEQGAPHKAGIDRFDMNHGVAVDPADPACGTVCCIAGAATQFFGDKGQLFVGQAQADLEFQGDGEAEWHEVESEARYLLDLDRIVADQLFRPNMLQVDWQHITPEKAGKVVRNLIDTGNVDWSIR